MSGLALPADSVSLRLRCAVFRPHVAIAGRSFQSVSSQFAVSPAPSSRAQSRGSSFGEDGAVAIPHIEEVSAGAVLDPRPFYRTDRLLVLLRLCHPAVC
eukprot:g41048.t1